MSSEHSPPDGGCRAFAVVFASFLCNGLIFGLVNSYSILYDPIRQVFEENGVTNESSKAALIGSLTIGTTFFLSMFAGMLSDRIGIRLTTFLGGFLVTCSLLISSFCTHQVGLLFFTYGILFGIGASLTYVPSLTIIGHYFKKYIGIANGFVTLGSSLFSIVMPFVLSSLLNSVGLNLCLRYMAILLSLLMFCSLIFKPVYKSPGSAKRPSNETSEAYFSSFLNLTIWRNKRYLIWVIAVPLALCGYFVPYVHMVKFIEINFKNENSKLPLICIAVTSGLGRIIFGPLSDYKKVDCIFLQQLSFFAIGIVSILIPLTTNYNILLLLNLILGIFDGCFISVIGPIAFQFCGPEGATQAIGFILGLSAFPLIMGPPIAGWLYDQNGSYTLPFILAGIPPILGALLLTKIHFIKISDRTDLKWITVSQVPEGKMLNSEVI